MNLITSKNMMYSIGLSHVFEMWTIQWEFSLWKKGISTMIEENFQMILLYSWLFDINGLHSWIVGSIYYFSKKKKKKWSMLTAVMIKGFKFAGPYSSYFSFVDTDFSIYNSHKFIILAPPGSWWSGIKHGFALHVLCLKSISNFPSVDLSGFSGCHSGY